MNVLAFSMSDKQYGVDIEQVDRLVHCPAITSVPDTAAFVEGVICIEGEIIPVVDLRKKFGLPSDSSVRQDRLLIARVKGHHLAVRIGQASEIVPLDPDRMTTPDDLLQEARYLAAMAPGDKGTLLIMDLETLFGGDTHETIQKLRHRVSTGSEPSGSSQTATKSVMAAARPASANAADEAKDILRLLVFDLGTEHYAVPLTQSQEVIVCPHITRVPRTPSFVCGIINFRGAILAVIDVRQLLALAPNQEKIRPEIIVTDVTGSSMGLLVDRVRGTLDVDAVRIQPPLAIRDDQAACAHGQINVAGDIYIVLDFGRLLRHRDIETLRAGSVS